MPLISKKRQTMTGCVEERVAANTNLASIFNDGLDDSSHYKELNRPTLEGHAEMRLKWRAFVEFYTKKDINRHRIPSEIEPGVQLVSEGVCKGFVTFLAAGTLGLLNDVAARVTIKNYINRFWALWRRYANVPIPMTLRSQIHAYVDSVDMGTVTPLTKDVRAKPIAQSVDLVAMIKIVFNDSRVFRTTRSKIQFILVNMISALTDERPGAIIESSKYHGSNEALEWGDTQFMVIPNSKSPRNPHIAVIITFRLPKGHRGDPHFYKSFFLLQEPLGLRAQCPVTLFLFLAILSGIFQDVSTVEEIVNPEIPPVKTHILRIKKECESVLVFLADEYRDGHYVTSATRALQVSTHSTQLHKVTMLMGYVVLMSMYCWRRGAAGRFNEELGEAKRKTLLTHGINSSMFKTAYEATLHGQDLGGILHERGQGEENLALTKAGSSMSVGADVAAPVRCSLEARGELLREPMLVDMRQKIVKLKTTVSKLRTDIKSLDEDEDDYDDKLADLQHRIALDIKTYRELQAEHDAIVNRELKLILANERKGYHQDHSHRQLTGEPAPSAPRMLLARPPLADKTCSNLPNPAPLLTSLGTSRDWLEAISSIDPVARLCDVIYDFAVSNLAQETIAAVNALLGVPERPFDLCYPGESPTDKELCPVCSVPCGHGAFRGNGSETVGSHIHKCIARAHQEQAQKFVEDSYSPQICRWDSPSCKAKNTEEYPTRPLFVAHVQKHLDSLAKAGTPYTPVRICRWLLEDGSVCGETCDDVDDNWYTHFAQVHDINAHEEVEVHYCVSCSQWHVDELGDGLIWEGHNHNHWLELFEPFSKRVDDADLDLTPIGIEYVDNRIEYVPGTGFGGVHPEFHGHFQLGVALVAPRCVFCVFAQHLPIEVRMKEFLKPTVFFKHLQTHEIDDNDNMCPLPSCGTHRYSRDELLRHLITFHRLPMCGSTNHTVVRGLKLPDIPAPAPAPASTDPPIDLAHFHDTMDVDEPAVAAPAESEYKSMVRRAKEARAADAQPVVAGCCLGCSRRYQDIGKHILRHKRCWETNEYRDDSDRTGTVQSWELTGPEPTGPGRGHGVKTHKCYGCRNQIFDIREHLDSPCKPTTFSIKIPGPGRKFGSKLVIKDWIAAQTNDAQDDDDRGEGSSKGTRKRHARVIQDSEGSDTDDRGEGSSEPASTHAAKRAAKRLKPAQQAPSSRNFVCNGCDERFTEVTELADHFGSLRKNSKCKLKEFRRRVSDTPGFMFGDKIKWEGWDGKP